MSAFTWSTRAIASGNPEAQPQAPPTVVSRAAIIRGEGVKSYLHFSVYISILCVRNGGGALEE